MLTKLPLETRRTVLDPHSTVSPCHHDEDHDDDDDNDDDDDDDDYNGEDDIDDDEKTFSILAASFPHKLWLVASSEDSSSLTKRFDNNTSKTDVASQCVKNYPFWNKIASKRIKL